VERRRKKRRKNPLVFPASPLTLMMAEQGSQFLERRRRQKSCNCLEKCCIYRAL